MHHLLGDERADTFAIPRDHGMKELQDYVKIRV